MEKLLRKHGIVPDPEMGQNFMTRSETIRKIVSLARFKRTETVLEIGAGLGFLTQEIAGKAKKVIAVEMDRKLASILEKEFAGCKNLEIIRGNILKVIRRIRCDVIVSNLPYAISEALLRKLTVYDFRRAVFVVPKGFAYKLIAKESEDNYSKLSVFAQSFFDIEIKMELSKDDFYPKPDTNSVVITVEKLPKNPVQKLFLWETKKMKNILLKILSDEKKMTKKQAKECLKSLKLNNKTLEQTAKNVDLKGIKTIVNALEKGLK
jgi:16S rRNA (adenine1518-N6/adenine1519-N6)-dimethyltransferase